MAKIMTIATMRIAARFGDKSRRKISSDSSAESEYRLRRRRTRTILSGMLMFVLRQEQVGAIEPAIIAATIAQPIPYFDGLLGFGWLRFLHDRHALDRSNRFLSNLTAPHITRQQHLERCR